MKPHRSRRVRLLVLSGALLGANALASDSLPEAASKKEAPSRIWSAEDGWLDISGFIDTAYGFVPVVIPITEPAVGLGGAGALVFIDKQKGEEKAGFGRPNISAIGALGTENGTRGAFAGDMRHWLDDRVKTLVGVVQASVNLDFYGIGRDPLLQDRPKSYNLETTAGVVKGQYRVGSSQVWVGLGYALASTNVKFDVLPEVASLPDLQFKSRVGGLLPAVSFDSRNNIFTPTSGDYLDLSAGLFSKALGSDTDFQRVNLTAIHYQPLTRDLTLGLLGNSVLSYGDVPFYLRPFVFMRGVPAMRYQGDYMAQAEAELRWQFWERISLVGFGGAGATRNENGRRDQNVAAGGFGFRYELARKYGLHMGLDFAHGPDGPAWYIQFGSAWMRP
ncbi:MAG: BamA/TamA family outer membrane protein [Burkholderiaceae bacterium]